MLPPTTDLFRDCRFPTNAVNGPLDSLPDREDLFARSCFFHAADRTVRRTENSGAFRGDFSGGISKRPDMSPGETGDAAKCQKSEQQHAEQTHCCFVCLQTSLWPMGFAWWKIHFNGAPFSLKFIDATSFCFQTHSQLTERIWRECVGGVYSLLHPRGHSCDFGGRCLKQASEYGDKRQDRWRNHDCGD